MQSKYFVQGKPLSLKNISSPFYKLKNIANKTKSELGIRKYRNQRNLVVKLNRKSRRDYFKSVQSNSIESDKKFWKTVKPLVANRNSMSEKITLIDDGKILANDMEIAERLNTYLTDITNTLDIEPTFKVIPEQLQIEQMVISAVEKFQSHKNICIIKKRLHVENSSLQFCHVNPMEVMRQRESLDKSKSNSGGIPTSNLRDAKRIVCPYLTDYINSAILDCKYQGELKKADISPICKGSDPMSIINFRLMSVLSSTSKVYERILKDQMSLYFKDKLRDILCGFREGYNTQHALIRVIEKWDKSPGNSGVVGTILMDLSKAFEYLPHDLLIAKLAAYGFYDLCLVYNYLT